MKASPAGHYQLQPYACLTVQYYEVLADLSAQKLRSSRCGTGWYLSPFKLLDFSKVDLLAAIPGALGRTRALTPAVRDALLNFDTLEFWFRAPDRFSGLGGRSLMWLANPRVLTPAGAACQRSEMTKKIRGLGQLP